MCKNERKKNRSEGKGGKGRDKILPASVNESKRNEGGNKDLIYQKSQMN